MFPEWHHAVPESAYFKVSETLKTFRMYPISRFVYVLHWLATRRVTAKTWMVTAVGGWAYASARVCACVRACVCVRVHACVSDVFAIIR